MCRDISVVRVLISGSDEDVYVIGSMEHTPFSVVARCVVWIVLVVIGSVIAEQVCGRHGQSCQSGSWRRWSATSEIYHKSDVGRSCFHPNSDLSTPVSSVSSFGIMSSAMLIVPAFRRGLVGIVLMSTYLAICSFLWHASASSKGHVLDVSGLRVIGFGVALDLWTAFRIFQDNPELYGKGRLPFWICIAINVAILGGATVWAYFAHAGLRNHVAFIAIPVIIGVIAVAGFGRNELYWILHQWGMWFAFACYLIAGVGLEIDSHTSCEDVSNWLNIHVYGHLFIGIGLFFTLEVLVRAVDKFPSGAGYKPLQSAIAYM